MHIEELSAHRAPGEARAARCQRRRLGDGRRGRRLLLGVAVLHIAQNGDGDGHDAVGQQSANGEQVDQLRQVEQARNEGREERCHNGARHGHLEARTDLAQKAKQQAILCHGVHDSGQGKERAKQTGQQANQTTDCNDPHGHRPADILEGVGQRGVDVLLVVRQHQGQHSGDAKVAEEDDEQREQNGARYVLARMAHLLARGGNAVEAHEAKEAGGGASQCALKAKWKEAAIAYVGGILRRSRCIHGPVAEVGYKKKQIPIS